MSAKATTPQHPQPLRIVRMREACDRTGLARTSIFRRIRDKQMPAPAPLGGGRAVGWRSDVFDSWLESIQK